MNAIRDDIPALVEKELAAANEKFGSTFNTLHEAYAVILEELEELHEEVHDAEAILDETWKYIKKNDADVSVFHLQEMYQSAERAAAEAIQVAAMCKKGILSEMSRLDRRVQHEL